MKCRKCGTEMQPGSNICPNCNAASGLKVWRIVLACVLSLIVGFVLTLVIMKDQGVDLSGITPKKRANKNATVAAAPAETTLPADTVAPTQEPATSTETVTPPPYDFQFSKADYTATETSDPAAVVATINGHELTVAELNAYYWNGVFEFLNQYYGYVQLDLATPFSQQLYSEDGETWEHIFLEYALNNWHKYMALYLDGQEAGYVMSDEMSQQLAEMHTTLEQAAKDSGYNTLDEMIKDEMGAMCTVDAYWAYMETFFYAMDYFNVAYAKMEPTDAEAEAWFEANKEDLTFTKETKRHNVRHILIEPAGGTEDGYGGKLYTDEEWEACFKEAEAILASWDGTEDGFAKLAKEKSVDTGSAENGGMYEDLTEETNFVEEFKSWYLDPIRQPGDTGIVKSSYGYHIMFYSGGEPLWLEESKNLAWQEKCESFVEALMKACTITYSDKNIALGQAKLS